MNTYIVSSAINTKFGVFNTDQRLQQTLDTIQSIKNKDSDSHIIVMECSGEIPSDEHIDILDKACDTLISLSRWEDVYELYNSTDNWDIVKNATEMLCFHKVLEIIKENNIVQSGRIFKISGRYTLTDDFDLSLYSNPDFQNSIIIKSPMDSQFEYSDTGVEKQYMSRLWSFPYSEIDDISDTFENMLEFMAERLENGGYVDIEHCLYKFLNQRKILQVDKIGITGRLGPNGSVIND